MCRAARASELLDDGDGDRELALWVIERSIAPAAMRSAHACARRGASRSLRASDDLDVAPGERSRDAESERLADGLLAANLPA